MGVSLHSNPHVQTMFELRPLWALSRPAGAKVSMGFLQAGGLPEVAHYAIDELAATGRPRLQPPGEIGSDKLRVEAGDILVSRLNPRRGHVFRVVAHDVPAVASSEFAVVRPHLTMDARFVEYVLQTDFIRQHLDSNVRSVTKSHGRVEFEYLWNALLPVPPVEVQRRIADHLDTETARIDALVAKNEQAVELVEERFWAVVEMLAGQSAGPTATLGSLSLSMADGPFGSSLSSKHYVDDGPRVIRLGNVGRANFKSGDDARIPHEHYEELRSHAVMPGDLVMAGLGDSESDAPAGRACVVPAEIGPAIVKADCFRVRLPSNCDAAFFAWQLSSPGSLGEAAALARGSTRARLNLSLAGQRRVTVPPLDEQRRVAARLEEERVLASSTRRALDQQHELLRERRAALIAAAVTGEREI